MTGSINDTISVRILLDRRRISFTSIKVAAFANLHT